MNKKILSLVFLFTLGFLSSCSLFQKQTLKKSKSKTKSIFLIVGYGSEHGIYYKNGSKTLLGTALNAGLGKPIKDVLEKVKSSDLATKYGFQYLQSRLPDEELEINPIYIDLASFKENTSRVKSEYRYDLKSYEVAGYKRAHIFNIKQFGITRKFNGIVPLSDPVGSARIQYSIVDLQTKKVLAKTTIESKESVIGKWEQKPKYNNLLRATQEAFKKTIQLVISKIKRTN